MIEGTSLNEVLNNFSSTASVLAQSSYLSSQGGEEHRQVGYFPYSDSGLKFHKPDPLCIKPSDCRYDLGAP
jgi:hypothetical protein